MSSVAQYSDILPHLTTKCLPIDLSLLYQR